MFRFIASSIFAVCPLTAPLAGGELPKPEPGWGRITGRVVFEGNLADLKDKQYLIDQKTRGVADALVYVRRPDLIHPALENEHRDPLAVVYEIGRLTPRTLILSVGQTVRILSRDGALTLRVNVFANNPIELPVTPDRPFEWRPTRAMGLQWVASSRQPGIVAHWLIVDHPYAVQTDSAGSFLLDSLPPGELELTVWHETCGERQLKVAVNSGQVTALPPFALTLPKPSR